jgi:hypothetical protein
METAMSKRAETLKRILELKDDFKLDLTMFKRGNSQNECSTSYCIAGRLAYLDNYPEEYSDGLFFDYISYSSDLIEVHRLDSALWKFLFSGNWPNSLIHAKERAQYVLDTGDVPEGWKSNYNWERTDD